MLVENVEGEADRAQDVLSPVPLRIPLGMGVLEREAMRPGARISDALIRR